MGYGHVYDLHNLGIINENTYNRKLFSYCKTNKNDLLI